MADQRIERIIQFGEGGFLRAFVDWMVKILDEKTDFHAGIAVVQPIPEGLCGLLSAQDCRYTHIMRGKEGVEKRVIDVITRCINPYTDYDAYLKLAENPDFRYIVSNTTEAGIAWRAEDGADDRPPVSFPAKVTALLWRRFSLGLPGFVFLPCELIESNGTALKALILRHGEAWGYPPAFMDWVERENIFYNTLVDRIVTGFPKDEAIETDFADRLLDASEYFHLWVLEGPEKIMEEIPFREAGLNVLVTDDLARYRTRKVRILNGAHTALVPYALLKGFETVKDCMDDGEMTAFLRGCVFEEIIPALDLPEEELIPYAEDVFTRFANPYIRHYLSSIALNSVSKFRVRVLPSILAYQQRFDRLPERLVFAFAMLIRFYQQGAPQDDPEAVRFIQNAGIPEILRNTALWGTDLEFLQEEVMRYAD